MERVLTYDEPAPAAGRLDQIIFNNGAVSATTVFETIRGPVAAGKLTESDLIQTRSGGYVRPERVRYVEIDPSAFKSFPDLAPLVIRKGSLGPSMPDRTIAVARSQRLWAETVGGENAGFGVATSFTDEELDTDVPACFVTIHCAKPMFLRANGVWVASN